MSKSGEHHVKATPSVQRDENSPRLEHLSNVAEKQVTRFFAIFLLKFFVLLVIFFVYLLSTYAAN